MSDQASPRGPTSAPFWGKYRATVVNNVDPQQIGRIQVICPDVTAVIPTTWAMPCVPLAGIGMGFFMVPPIGAGVWLEFEQGDPDYPIWVGGYWGSAAEVPAMSHLVPPGQGFAFQSVSGVFIAVSDTGIIINNGKGASIVIAPGGPIIDFNLGALQVS